LAGFSWPGVWRPGVVQREVDFAGTPKRVRMKRALFSIHGNIGGGNIGDSLHGNGGRPNGGELEGCWSWSLSNAPSDKLDKSLAIIHRIYSTNRLAILIETLDKRLHSLLRRVNGQDVNHAEKVKLREWFVGKRSCQ